MTKEDADILFPFISDIQLAHFKMQHFTVMNMPIPEVLMSDYLLKLDLLTEKVSELKLYNFNLTNDHK